MIPFGVVNQQTLGGGGGAVTIAHLEASLGRPDSGDLNSMVLSVPTGGNAPVEGELLIAIIHNDNWNGSTMYTPAGWTKVFQEGWTDSDCFVGVYWKVATASEIDTTFTWQYSAQSSVGYHLRIQNADTIDPVDVTLSSRASSGSSIVAAEITTTVANCLILAGANTDGEDMYPITLGGGWGGTIELMMRSEVGGETPDRTNGTTAILATKILESAGVTGDATFTAAKSDGSVRYQMAIKPA